MDRKVHPIGFRLNVNQDWRGRWLAEDTQYREQLHQDFAIREAISREAGRAGVSRIDVERFPGKVKASVFTAKPGILIGRKGEGIKKIRIALEALTYMFAPAVARGGSRVSSRRARRGRRWCSSTTQPRN